MGLLLDSTTSSTKHRVSSPGTSHSFSHSVGSGKSRVALFLICVTISNTGVDQTGFSATYGGTSMTKIGEISFSGKYMTVSAFQLVNPATGSNTVAISWTGSSGGLFAARSYSGVDVSTPVRPSSWQTSTGTTSPSLSVPTSTQDIILDGMCAYSTGTATGTGHSTLYSETTTIAPYSYVGHVPTPGSTPLTIGWTVGNWFVHGAFSIQPAGSDGGPVISPTMIF